MEKMSWLVLKKKNGKNYLLGDNVNSGVIERLERRNQVIRLIMVSVAIVSILVFIIYYFFIGSSYNNNISNIKFQNGAMKENKVREKLEYLIK